MKKYTYLLGLLIAFSVSHAQWSGTSDEILTTGKVGIGVPFPYGTLDIITTDNFHPELRVTRSFFAAFHNQDVQPLIEARTEGGNPSQTSGNGIYSRKFVVDWKGRVGVNTNNFEILTDFQIGDIFHFQGGSSGTMSNNAYNLGSGYKRTRTGAASQISMTNNGDIYIRGADEGAAGSAVTWNNGMRIRHDGKVGIGPVTSTEMDNADNYLLYVHKGIISERVKVELKSNWLDYVFKEGYALLPLPEVENFIKQNNHLPDVPSELDVKENGIDMAEMDATLLRKIEELTLYMIEQNKSIEKLKEQNQLLQQQIEKLN